MIKVTQKIADLNKVLETEGGNTIYGPSTFIVATIENGKDLCIRVYFFLFGFPAKRATPITIGLS